MLDAIVGAACNGTSFGASTPAEADLAELVIGAFPNMQKVRFVSSGTEATMSAIRLARAYTKRKYIVKFEGCYHGHADALLVKAGSGVATLGIPGSAGVPDEFIQFSVALPFNNLSAVEHAFQKYKHQIACVIVEPVVGNMGCVPAADDYLVGLRLITERERSVLIFDEVMTGFRVAYRRSAGAVQHQAGPDDDGKDYWRRLAGGRVWWSERNHGSGCAAGADVSGGDTVGESAGDGRGMRDAETVAREEGGDLSAAREAERGVGGRRGGGGERGGSGGLPQSRGIDVYVVLPGRVR